MISDRISSIKRTHTLRFQVHGLSTEISLGFGGRDKYLNVVGTTDVSFGVHFLWNLPKYIRELYHYGLTESCADSALKKRIHHQSTDK